MPISFLLFSSQVTVLVLGADLSLLRFGGVSRSPLARSFLTPRNGFRDLPLVARQLTLFAVPHSVLYLLSSFPLRSACDFRSGIFGLGDSPEVGCRPWLSWEEESLPPLL